MAKMRKKPTWRIDQAAWNREHQHLFGQAFHVSMMGEGVMGVLAEVVLIGSQCLGRMLGFTMDQGLMSFVSVIFRFLRCTIPIYTHCSCSTFVFIAGRMTFPLRLCFFSHVYTDLLHMLQFVARPRWGLARR